MTYAGLEHALIAERVRAGMQRARREGKHLGRPPATARADVRRRWPEVAAAIEDGRHWSVNVSGAVCVVQVAANVTPPAGTLFAAFDHLAAGAAAKAVAP